LRLVWVEIESTSASWGGKTLKEDGEVERSERAREAVEFRRRENVVLGRSSNFEINA